MVQNVQHSPDGPIVPTWTLGDRLEKARHEAHMTQPELAETMGISRRSIIRFETDEKVPSRALLVAWSHFTNVDLHWLTGNEPDPPLRIMQRGEDTDRTQGEPGSRWIPVTGDGEDGDDGRGHVVVRPLFGGSGTDARGTGAHHDATVIDFRPAV